MQLHPFFPRTGSTAHGGGFAPVGRRSIRRLAHPGVAVAAVALITLTVEVLMIDFAALNHRVNEAIDHMPDPLDDIVFAFLWLTSLVFAMGMYGWHRRTLRQRRVEAQLKIRVLHEARECKAREARVQRIQDILHSPQSLRILYQPIVALASGRIHGYEALSRFPSGAPPEVCYSEAAQVGLLQALEKLAIARALDGLPELPKSAYVSVNVSPTTLLDPGFLALFRDVPPERVVLELTEQLRIDEYEEHRAVVARLRRLGLRLAVDDAGAGWASLRHILQLRPDIVKADRDLLAGVPDDPVPTTLLKGLAEFIHAIPGAIIIAEGIETEAQVALLQAININFGQGLLLGPPEPVGAQITPLYGRPLTRLAIVRG